ncbi:hypothetical protein VNO78_25015 [Psophocarpus tetragonolobus]|uniref:Non-haem dioxygenase N-terminal domain-containing protein n=1 Tax=Psophocarpus tetragonolobus TaxID=3891 RepID=A0AAN9XFE8_PSOTE
MGSSIPSKPLLTELASTIDRVPSNFIRPIGERPKLHQLDSFTGSIPVVDLEGLHGSDRSKIIHEIGHACQNYGFFQIVKHGIAEEVVSKMVKVSKEFFGMEESERVKNYSDDPWKTTRLSTSFNVKTEKVANWRDFLRLQCHPIEDYIAEWPTKPSGFREDVAEYSRKMRGLCLKLLEAISESLGLERDYIEKALGEHGQHMAIN